jgi:hypothetical protein
LEKDDDGRLKKVMVWIHGGAFIFGGAYFYNPAYFMEEDVVLVNNLLLNNHENNEIENGYFETTGSYELSSEHFWIFVCRGFRLTWKLRIFGPNRSVEVFKSNKN